MNQFVVVWVIHYSVPDFLPEVYEVLWWFENTLADCLVHLSLRGGTCHLPWKLNEAFVTVLWGQVRKVSADSTWLSHLGHTLLKSRAALKEVRPPEPAVLGRGGTQPGRYAQGAWDVWAFPAQQPDEGMSESWEGASAGHCNCMRDPEQQLTSWAQPTPKDMMIIKGLLLF